MEEKARLMGGAEQRLGYLRPAKPVDDGTGLRWPAPDLQIVMNGLGGEVKELQVDSWWDTLQADENLHYRQRLLHF